VQNCTIQLIHPARKLLTTLNQGPETALKISHKADYENGELDWPALHTKEEQVYSKFIVSFMGGGVI
jgi:hypothetical protein